ncbi:glycosyltransferase family 4 protein [Myroides guanonis]|uniref:Glycosyltransferase involved in cell wall bisynthesis n=1 Tax=Myroides guanonis TaxID=1150112 RepID=A0A1I3RJQ7_9FLAO|nr:glycosyltransferase family 4 protein [Myroides guanonis]SFJ46833.1 Glycosyltransferase involved in cell wall bisynthesis [Myroides guanonis]
MKLAIITSRYPKETQPYNHMFVHVRALYFQSKGVDVTILVPAKKNETYTFQGIRVIEDSSSSIVSILSRYDVLYLHLLNQYPLIDGGFKIYNEIVKAKYKTAIYLHGADTLTYPNGFFDFKWNLKGISKVLYTNVWKKYYMSRFLNQLLNTNSLILTPSIWLANRVEAIYGIEKGVIKVIPNGIDTDFFKSSGGYKNRYKMLCIRPLNSEYPVEDCVRLMSYLPEFFTLDIYGEGENYERIKQLIEHLGLSDRVQIINGFFDREELPKLFQNYGIFNAFSRSDTQGVIMCEALSSMMLVLSTNKTAIPEFISDGTSGLLLNENESIQDFANRIIAICEDKTAFDDITANARESMQQINWKLQGEKELKLLQSL